MASLGVNHMLFREISLRAAGVSTFILNDVRTDSFLCEMSPRFGPLLPLLYDVVDLQSTILMI